MKILFGIIALLGISTSWLYAETASKDAEIAKQAAEIQKLNIDIKLHKVSVSVLEAQLETVRTELEEIQVLSAHYAERSAYLNEQLNIQTQILSVTKNDKEMYLEALKNILIINESHKKCIIDNLSQGTLASDGSRTVVAGQSSCFAKYKESVTQIATQYGEGHNA